VASEHLADTGFFDSRYLRRLADEHTSGRRDHGSILWALLMFEGFLRQSASSAAQ
jgi:asparagine synthase (glutamine-hydrolysing)